MLNFRCYMTLTQALTFHLGGSPSGPAGTGKVREVRFLCKYLRETVHSFLNEIQRTYDS